MYHFKANQTLFIDNVAYRVVRTLNPNEVQLEDAESGELSKRSTTSLMEAYTSGALLTSSERRQRLRQPDPSPSSHADMVKLSETARTETQRRIDILARLDGMGSFEKSRKELKEDLKVVAAARGDHRPVHESTVYRWRRKLRLAMSDVRALFAEFDKQGGRGRSRLDPEVEAMIDAAVDDEIAKNKGVSAQAVHLSVLLKVSEANTTRVEAEHFKVPGLRTVQRRIQQLYSFELDLARYGRKEAERRHAHYGSSRAVKRILEIVEIDHTPVDLLVVDNNGVVIGRPMLTVVLDRKSRCVLGFHLSLAGHGTRAVFAALRHAFLPKTYLSTRYGGKLDWPCYGWPERVLMDNGREFHANAVQDALASLSITAEYAGSRDPNDKPFVERFLRTLNYTLIHRLPGTTLSHVHKRIGFKAEEQACLTLEQLDEIIHQWICNSYHRRPHRGLCGQAPIVEWAELAKAYPPQLKMNREDIDIEFCDVEHRTIHHYGIEINTFTYASEELSLLRRQSPKDATVTVKAPTDEAGFIWVWNTVIHEYMKVPNKDEQYNGLTVEQAKAAKKRQADPANQQVNAEAHAVIADLVATAMKDPNLKARKRAARMANKTSEKFREDQPETKQEPTPGREDVPDAGLPAEELPEIEMDFGGSAPMEA
jgi:putative transposase